MHPTLTPERQRTGPVESTTPLAPTREQLARAHADLVHIADAEIRTTFALGYLDAVLHDAARHADNPAIIDAVTRGLAILSELAAIEREKSRYTYDRDDAPEETTLTLDDVDGYALGRRCNR